MKLLTEEILIEYGFIENPEVLDSHNIKVMSKNAVHLVLRTDGIYYQNMGFFYPLKDLSDLRKLYKELRREELTKS